MMESHLEIEVHSRPVSDGVHLVEVSGEIDLYTGPKVKNCIHDLIDAGTYRLIVSLENVRYMDSTGLGILMSALKRVEEKGGRIVIICKNARVLKIFKLTGFVHTFSIFDGEAEAIASFN